MVSVIIPVYNVAPYLRKCLDSVIAQSFSDLEIIIIDDGATDESGAICDEYAILDSRIRVIHQENGGLSNARNRGIKEAAGEYLYFLDSDDWLEPDCIEKLMEAIEDRDLAWCSNVHDRGQIETPVDHTLEEQREDADTFQEMMKRLIAYHEVRHKTWMLPNVWNKLYRSDIIREHNLHYDEEAYYVEDMVFNYDYIVRCEKGGRSTNLPLYHYVTRDSSIMGTYRNGFDKKNLVLPLYYEKICLDLKNRTDDKDFLDFWGGRTAYFFHSALWKMVKRGYENPEFEKKAREWIRTHLSYFWKDSLIDKKVKLSTAVCAYAYPVWKGIVRWI